MRIGQLIEFLQIFPLDTEVMVQTCEGDLLSPLQNRNLWLTESWIDQKYKNLEPSKLIITAFIKGMERLEYKNQQSGVMVKYEPKEAKHD